MAIVSNLELIRRVPLFAMLTDEQANVIADSVSKQRFRRGAILVRQDFRSESLYILLNGRASVLSADTRQREVILATLRQGDCIGEMSLIDNEPHSATVRLEVQTDVLVLGRDAFMRCMPEEQSLALAVMRGLVARLRRSTRKIESLALSDVYSRVVSAMVEFSAVGPDGRRLMRDKVSQQHLAKMVGASRATVSRVMKDLEDQGVVIENADGSIELREYQARLD
jgi:CRP/FNR family transcriptional regulator, cyclic AMP receptor protein